MPCTVDFLRCASGFYMTGNAKWGREALSLAAATRSLGTDASQDTREEAEKIAQRYKALLAAQKEVSGE